jgi:alpha-glucosidase (family GH31 glycosyl hydrolase)
MKIRFTYTIVFFLAIPCMGFSQDLIVAGRASQLDIRKAGEKSLRITLKPVTFREDFSSTPALTERKYEAPAISMKQTKPLKKSVGRFTVEIAQNPLTLTVSDNENRQIQKFTFLDDETVSFLVNDEVVLGLGEGGSKPAAGVNWRNLAVEFDRSGRYDSMIPRWQRDAYGSRNPAPVMIGTSGWATFVVSPWVQVDLRSKGKGMFIPRKTSENDKLLQTEQNQWSSTAKGLPPPDKVVPGLFDFFVFDASDPEAWMNEFSRLTGPASMPPKWALGYMQSHRRLDDDAQITGIVDTFRTKKIPVDAVIYLGTGFTPRGWNKKQPSFEFNPEVFKREPAAVIADMHARHVNVVLHMVPWDRDKLPSLHGSIPAKKGELLDASHIQNYWNEHMPLVKAGVDAFWPDEGDWFNLYERIKRHQLYYQGFLSVHPDIRPWSLQRNGYPGIAQWGGWVWSGDTESSWKSLEAQIAVGLNYSLSIGPYWGSDIGGFFPNEELTGELYARWFQFGAFCGSFRSHGQTWHVRLPWGWSGNAMGPKESRANPLQSEMNNKAIEPVIKKYDELRYQLLPYTYTLAWEARTTGMPLMRSMWLHYPKDKTATQKGDQFLWGRDMLIAPVFEKGATSRKVYLPEGDWYDWWTNEKLSGKQTISRHVDLSVMPVYVRA